MPSPGLDFEAIHLMKFKIKIKSIAKSPAGRNIFQRLSRAELEIQKLTESNFHFLASFVEALTSLKGVIGQMCLGDQLTFFVEASKTSCQQIMHHHICSVLVKPIFKCISNMSCNCTHTFKSTWLLAYLVSKAILMCLPLHRHGKLGALFSTGN